MEEIDLKDIIYVDDCGVIEDDDVVSYGDVTVRRSHVSEKKTATEKNNAPKDRTGAATFVDLQRLTAPLKSLRSSFAAVEDPVSDQLPNVDEYKTHTGFRGGSNSQRTGIREMLKRSMKNKAKKSKNKSTTSIREFVKQHAEMLFIALMVVCILLGIIIVGSAWLKNSKESSGNNLSDGDVDRMSNERYNHIVKFIAGQGWTSKYKLSMEGSPQTRAALWLADFDEDQIPATNTPEFRERYALAVFFFAMNGRDWDRDIGFMSQNDVCTWGENDVKNEAGTSIRIGVDCTCRHPKDEKCLWKDTKTVKRLLLPSMNLEGSIPHEISLLYDLIELDLNSNKLIGEISQGILLLRSLRILSLSESRLQGNLPGWIVDMPELRELNLASNQLKGTLPKDMAKLTNLLMMNLNDNQLSGVIEPLKELQQIEALFLRNNDFEGPLKREFVDWWPWLRVLDLGDNNMGNTLPGNVFAHPTLHVLDLHANGMSGQIPEIPSNSKVQFLALQGNSLGGSIPDSISNLSSMYHLDLSRNKLTGGIPNALGSLQNLQYLFLSFNDFTEGNVPHYFGSMTNLKDLSLQSTRRKGHIPRALETLSNLSLLDLGDNSLSGSIPSSLGNLSQLRFLILYRNYLTGGIPSELKALDQLSKLILHTNDITERADYMCLPQPPPQLSDFVMDCGNELFPGGYPYCPCCQCCTSPDVDCDSLVWFGGFDEAWDTKFVRRHYKFHENEISPPS